jgi:hypothetical protein
MTTNSGYLRYDGQQPDKRGLMGLSYGESGRIRYAPVQALQGMLGMIRHTWIVACHACPELPRPCLDSHPLPDSDLGLHQP